MIDKGFDEDSKDWTCIITNGQARPAECGPVDEWWSVLPVELGARAYYMLMAENGERP